MWSDALVEGIVPTPLSSFVGRDRELAELRGLLSRTRLLTLTGAGGSGKTRLALRLAASAGAPAAFLVELGELPDGALVDDAVLEAVGAPAEPGRPALQVAAERLGDRHALVVLDSCEHVVDAAAEAARTLLLRCPSLQVLATSRVSLDLSGEMTWPVPPLSLSEDAVALFLERASAARPAFTADGQERETVAAICHELDGLPLAIELAAARLRMLSLDQLATALADRFRLLTQGPRGAPARQRTLRASIDWSHGLLDEPERVLLRRLSVFVGGWKLEAAQRVCDDPQLLDRMAALVDSSLVVVEERRGSTRYRLLETIRHYAAERLEEAGETRLLRDRHLEHYAALAEDADDRSLVLAPAMRAQLDAELPNLRAALEHGARQESDEALRLAAALTWFWRERGLFGEGIKSTTWALRSAREEPSVPRARALAGLAVLRGFVGDYARSRDSGLEAIAAAELAGDPRAHSVALGRVAIVVVRHDPGRGRALAHRAVAAAREAGHALTLGEALSCQVVVEGVPEDEATLERIVPEALAVARRIGHVHAMQWCWWAEGRRAWARGDAGAVADCARRMAGAAPDLREPVVRAAAASLAAIAAALTGTTGEARVQALSELEHARESESDVAAGLLAVALAELALAEGDVDEARRWAEPLCAGHSFITPYMRWRGLRVLLETSVVNDDQPAAREQVQALVVHADGTGNRHALAVARRGSARIALAAGDDAGATQLAQEALGIFAENGWELGTIDTLELLAAVAATQADLARARRLLAATAAARSARRLVRIPPDTSFWDRVAGAMTAEPVPDQPLTLEDAVAYVRRSRGPRDRPLKGWAGLTPVEAEVAELAAIGLTNPQIGARLFISRSTVKVHLSRVFTKLGVSGRGELIAAAAKRVTPE